MSNKSLFYNGIREGLPITIAVTPFGLLFGAFAVENGLSVAQATLMSATLFAGASQMVGIELFGQDIVPWMIVFSIFAVNFRHVLYSATLGRRLNHMNIWQKGLVFGVMTDVHFALAEQRAVRGQTVSLFWYLGVTTPIYVFWVIEAWIGATFGQLIENTREFGIDFILSVYFLALLLTFASSARFMPVVLGSAIASAAAFLTIGSPWHVSIGAIAGVLVAVVLPVKEADAS